VCLNHASPCRHVSPAGVRSRGTALSRRGFVTALLAGASGAALSACDPAGVGNMFVSEDQVEEMGVETWDRLRAQLPASSNRAYQQTARRVADRILRAAGENPRDWEVRVFARNEANAFALPGNKIGVYEGMFRFARDEDQLAAVIGHEIGHDQAQHARERLAREVGTQAGLQLVSAALQVGNIGYADQIAGLLGAGAQFGIILPYTREQELEADRIGLANMARAGYDPRAAIQLWENMSRQPRSPEFLSTHPAPESRIAALEEQLPKALATYRASG
jgi:predicted Zn-dependent protease